MGVKGLAGLIAIHSPSGVSNEPNLRKYFGKKVAVDASMILYQCLVSETSSSTPLKVNKGHLTGTFFRSINLLESGIKPLYVFDGKPPKSKLGRLKNRRGKRERAKTKMEEADLKGDKKTVLKYKRRLIKVNENHVKETKDLLNLMGIPYIDAPGEAEAQCAELVQAGKVYATATEDMDALTFGSEVLLRHLTFKFSRKMPIQEFTLYNVLKGLGLNYVQFIDLSILLGCDYCKGVSMINPKRVVKMIQKYKGIEDILKIMGRNKLKVPKNWDFKEARNQFINPLVADCDDVVLQWKQPDRDGITNYLCGEHFLNENKIRKGVIKLTSLKYSKS